LLTLTVGPHLQGSIQLSRSKRLSFSQNYCAAESSNSAQQLLASAGDKPAGEERLPTGRRALGGRARRFPPCWDTLPAGPPRQWTGWRFGRRGSSSCPLCLHRHS